jgi:hypothetical protein
MRQMELLKTFQNTSYQLFKTSGAFENFSEHYMETFQNTGACIAIHAQITKPGALLVGRRPLLANGGILRCEPAEHVLPIIQRCTGMQ